MAKRSDVEDSVEQPVQTDGADGTGGVDDIDKADEAETQDRTVQAARVRRGKSGATGRLQVAGASPFTASFPDDARLRQVVEAFEQGRYRDVQRLAPQLIDTTDDLDVKRSAAEILQRLVPDPLAGKLLTATAVLLALLTAWAYVTNNHVHP